MDAVKKDIIDLSEWMKQPIGQYFLSWEQALLDKRVVNIFGFNALQIGLPQINTLYSNRMSNRWLCHCSLPEQDDMPLRPPHLLVDFTELPFATHSIDLVVLPHILEFVKDPHQVLREVERILIPEGRLIVCGFNQRSLWGMRQKLGKVGRDYFLPSTGEFIHQARLRDWLKLLNLEFEELNHGCYVPPIRSEKWLHRFAFMERMGAKYWPGFGAVYVIQAVKRVRGMRLIGKVEKRTALAPHNAIPIANKILKCDELARIIHQHRHRERCNPICTRTLTYRKA